MRSSRDERWAQTLPAMRSATCSHLELGLGCCHRSPWLPGVPEDGGLSHCALPYTSRALKGFTASQVIPRPHPPAPEHTATSLSM